MPRITRIAFPRYSYHVVRRGHNRQVVFAEEADYVWYLQTQGSLRKPAAIGVVPGLTTNHVYLLLAPEDANGFGQLLKRLA